MENSQKEKNQKTAILILSAVIVILLIVIVVLAISRRTVTESTVQQTTTPSTTALVATSTNAAPISLQTFINTKYKYQFIFPASMTVLDAQSGGNPTVSGLVSFNGQAVNIPSFTVSASANPTQSNNNGSLVCEKFINGTYTSFPVHSLIFYYGNVSTQNGPILTYCTINHGIKYTIASIGPSTTDSVGLLRDVVGSFSLVK